MLQGRFQHQRIFGDGSNPNSVHIIFRIFSFLQGHAEHFLGDDPIHFVGRWNGGQLAGREGTGQTSTALLLMWRRSSILALKETASVVFTTEHPYAAFQGGRRGTRIHDGDLSLQQAPRKSQESFRASFPIHTAPLHSSAVSCLASAGPGRRCLSPQTIACSRCYWRFCCLLLTVDQVLL